MKVTVTNSSSSLGDLISAADKIILQSKIGTGTPTSIVLYNNEDGQVLYIETLGKTATTANGFPVAYQGVSPEFLVEDTLFDDIVVIGDAASLDVRILINALDTVG